jgi:hypothetical protein
MTSYLEAKVLSLASSLMGILRVFVGEKGVSSSERSGAVQLPQKRALSGFSK